MVFNDYIAHFLVWRSLLNRCVGIPCLQGCMIYCSWNFTITPILPTSNSSIFKRTIWSNLGKMSISTQCSISRLTFSYSSLLICALHGTSFVHDSFYHWLYIIINNINSCGRTSLLVWKIRFSLAKHSVKQHYYYQNYYLLSQVCQL